MGQTEFSIVISCSCYERSRFLKMSACGFLYRYFALTVHCQTELKQIWRRRLQSMHGRRIRLHASCTQSKLSCKDRVVLQ